MNNESGNIIEFNDNIDVDLNYILENKTTLLAGQSDISEKNVELNKASIEEYLETQEEDVVHEKIDILYSHFQGFIAKHIEKVNSNILDVGCGMGKNFPRYFRLLSRFHNYFGLDPVKMNLEGRSYPLFCCGVEDLKKTNLNKRFDMVLFSSSLDHIEDISQTLNVLKEKVDRKVVIWVALNDSDMIALNYGEHYFKYIFSIKNVFGRLFRLIIIFLKGLRLLVVFSRLERKLRKKIPLDPYHFHYFTNKSFFNMLEQHGEIKERLVVPGSNSVFVYLILNK
jgi:2-polyprenyl-3-methyl-5-hydroxy-6-metoxy-1,4-benzoquinol methylase